RNYGESRDRRGLHVEDGSRCMSADAVASGHSQRVGPRLSGYRWLYEKDGVVHAIRQDGADRVPGEADVHVPGVSVDCPGSNEILRATRATHALRSGRNGNAEVGRN